MAVRERPIGVTIIAILSWIVGVLHVGSGVWLLFNLVLVGDIWQAILDLFVGLLAIVVGVALLQGNALARVVATVVFGLNVIAGLIAAFTMTISWPWFGGLSAGLLAFIGVVLLWTPRASRFFRNG
jgi:hypothetical protein